jgi:hypothetical protein
VAWSSNTFSSARAVCVLMPRGQHLRDALQRDAPVPGDLHAAQFACLDELDDFRRSV